MRCDNTAPTATAHVNVTGSSHQVGIDGNEHSFKEHHLCIGLRGDCNDSAEVAQMVKD